MFPYREAPYLPFGPRMDAIYNIINSFVPFRQDSHAEIGNISNKCRPSARRFVTRPETRRFKSENRVAQAAGWQFDTQCDSVYHIRKTHWRKEKDDAAHDAFPIESFYARVVLRGIRAQTAQGFFTHTAQAKTVHAGIFPISQGCRMRRPCFYIYSKGENRHDLFYGGHPFRA